MIRAIRVAGIRASVRQNTLPKGAATVSPHGSIDSISSGSIEGVAQPRPPRIGRRRSINTAQEVHDILEAADAFNAFTVVAALVCGFSVSCLIEAACEFKEELISTVRIASFVVLMALAAALSGFATVFMTLEVYYIKRMAMSSPASLYAFLQYTAFLRWISRNATYAALAAIFVGLALLLWDFVGGGGFAIAIAVMLGSAAIAVFATASRMYRLAVRAEASGNNK